MSAGRSQFVQILSPSPVVLVWQSFVSFAVLVLGSAPTILAAVTGSSDSGRENSLISDAIGSTLEFIDGIDASADIVTFMFWAALGSGLYAALWSFTSLVIELYRDVSFGFSFIHPQEFNRSQHWSATASAVLVRVSAVIILLSFMGYFLAQILPGLSNIVSSSVAGMNLLSLFGLVVGVGMCTISLHFMTVLIRVFLLRTSIINTN